VKGNRRDHYAADRDIWKIATSRLKLGLERRVSEANGAIAQAEKMLKNSEKKLNGKDKELAGTYMEKIKDVREMAERIEKLLAFLPMDL